MGVVGLVIISMITIIAYYRLDTQRFSYIVGFVILITIISGPVVYGASTITVKPVAGLPTAGPDPHNPFGKMNSHNPFGEMNPQIEETVQKIIQQISVDGSQYQWIAATVGPLSSYIQLRSGYSVLPIGGFTGMDDNLPLRVFQQDIIKKKIHYLLTMSDDPNDFMDNISPLILYAKKNFPVTRFTIPRDQAESSDKETAHPGYEKFKSFYLYDLSR